MRVSQRARLIDAGITTVAELAAHSGAVPELAPRTVASLTAQARLQITPKVDGKPAYEVVDAQPLMVLPDANKGDLFFDFEGDPLWTVDGREWGLEYLWGVLTVGRRVPPVLGARPRQRTPGAGRLPRDGAQAAASAIPDMHIYHYAAYEKSTLLRLAGRYGVGENDVDDLLRNGVLVDLYPLVRKSIRVGTENYSIKSLEPLYMGNELRSGEVTTATDSITQYARYCALRDEGRADEAAAVLKEIEDYNVYDCRSTRRLRDWMMARAIESGVPPRGPQPVRDDERDRTRRRPRPQAAASSPATASNGAHRRADGRRDGRGRHGVFTGARTSRSGGATSTGSTIPSTNGPTTATCSSPRRREIVNDWHQPPKARKPQRHVRLFGEIANGELAKDMYALYDPPAPAGLADDPDRRGVRHR